MAKVDKIKIDIDDEVLKMIMDKFSELNCVIMTLQNQVATMQGQLNTMRFQSVTNVTNYAQSGGIE